MNLLSATVSADGRKAEIGDGDSLELPADFSAQAGRPITLGMRPEHLQVVNDGGTSTNHTVEVVEHLGADTLVHGNFGSRRADLTVSLKGIRTINPGEVVPLAIEPQNVHVFDPETGHRLDTG